MTAARSRRRVALADDSGATLILALVIVTVVALVLGAMLSFVDTSLRTTVQLRGQGNVAATADGAAQAAINDLRLHTYNNDTSSSTYPNCFGTSEAGKTLVLPDLVPGGSGGGANSAAVRCDPDTNTGAAGGLVPINNANKPGNAILTLSGNPSETGLTVKANSTTIPFNVHGGIVSNSNIAVTNGSLQSNSTVFARTGCSGSITSVPSPASCTFGGALPGDPAYTAEISTVPPYRPAPTSCSGGMVTFLPGYYDDAKALTDLMASNTCKNTVWWFKPGAYYFDFQNPTKSSSSANAHQWVVGVGQLVAGTPVDASGGVLAQPQKPAVVPGACANPIKSTTAVGVQFLFGGDSQLEVAGEADAEICGSYDPNRVPITIYGVRSGTATPTTVTNGTASTVTGTVTGVATGFAPPAAGTLASALTTAGDGKEDTFATTTTAGTATLRLTGFPSAATTVPAGTNLTAATLRIVYGTSTAATTRTLSITPSSSTGAGTAITPTVSTAAQTGTQTQRTQTFDLLSSLKTPVHDKGLTDLQVDYSTKLATNGAERIDAVLLDLTYTAPALRGETTAAVPGNCLAIPYTLGSAGTGRCAVLYTATNYKGRFYVQGTTYTPLAPIDLALSNVTSQVLRFGVISRTLTLMETGAVSYQGPVIELPDNSPGYGVGDTVVYLSVTVCPGVSTCAFDAGQVALRARVYIHDPTGAPVSGSREMIVQTWAVQRR